MNKFIVDTFRERIKRHKAELSEAEREINKLLIGRDVVLKDGRKGTIRNYELLCGNECLKIFFSTNGQPYKTIFDEWDCRWIDFRECEIL